MIRIRPLQEEDIPDVHAIDAVSFSLPWPKESFEMELRNPVSLCRVAEVCGPDGDWHIVGMMITWIIVDEAHIATIAVHPDYRQQGVARLLLASMLKTSIELGVCMATLEVRYGNKKAQRLYESFKFEVVAKRPCYYSDNNEDALIMTVNGLGKEYLMWLEKYQVL